MDRATRPALCAAAGRPLESPESFPTLYFNEDVVTARLNLRLFVSGWPYEPEDLRDETGPLLVGVKLPGNQRVADVHSRDGVAAVGLPASYPLDSSGNLVPHSRCQAIGQRAKDRGLRGVRCRSARAPDGAGRELAWFPSTARSRASQTEVIRFERWFWG